MRFVLLSLVLFCGSLAEHRESRLIQTSQGPVRGYKDPGEDVFVFHSIPYAKAPTGVHRYKAPLPALTWTETFEAIDKGIVCPQPDFLLQHFKDKKIQEDCLIANIYVPSVQNKKLPVLVYVHGGAYMIGFGDMATHKKLVASQQIIVVNFNYRLGPHGFLCLGTEDIPGNAGMKDQVALLRWVKQNIASFGGDPDNVTIGGGSAGSSAVDLLMISKVTNDLFNKVIPESGANVAAFSIQSNPIENAKEYAKLLKFNDVDDFYSLEEFYKLTPYEQIFTDSVMYRNDSVFLMSPCIEQKTNEEAFLTDSAVNILKSGKYKKLPMLYGFAQMEGLFRAPLFEIWKGFMNAKFSDFLPADLEFQNEKQKRDVADKIKKFYFSDKQIEGKEILSFIDYFTDVIFAYPTLRSVQLQVEAGNDQIYLYEYSYADSSTPVIPYTNVRGANHCAQSMAIADDFGLEMYKMKSSEEYETMRTTLRKVWINFIVTGKPIPETLDLPAWPPVGPEWSPHMSIDKKWELKGSLLKERASFWEEIYGKYYRSPVPPSKLPKYNSEL